MATRSASSCVTTRHIAFACTGDDVGAVGKGGVVSGDGPGALALAGGHLYALCFKHVDHTGSTFKTLRVGDRAGRWWNRNAW